MNLKMTMAIAALLVMSGLAMAPTASATCPENLADCPQVPLPGDDDHCPENVSDCPAMVLDWIRSLP